MLIFYIICWNLYLGIKGYIHLGKYIFRDWEWGQISAQIWPPNTLNIPTSIWSNTTTHCVPQRIWNCSCSGFQPKFDHWKHWTTKGPHGQIQHNVYRRGYGTVVVLEPLESLERLESPLWGRAGRSPKLSSLASLRARIVETLF